GVVIILAIIEYGKIRRLPANSAVAVGPMSDIDSYSIVRLLGNLFAAVLRRCSGQHTSDGLPSSRGAARHQRRNRVAFGPPQQIIGGDPILGDVAIIATNETVSLVPH